MTVIETLDQTQFEAEVEQVRAEYAGCYYIPDSGPYMLREHDHWYWCWDNGAGGSWKESSWPELRTSVLLNIRMARNLPLLRELTHKHAGKPHSIFLDGKEFFQITGDTFLGLVDGLLAYARVTIEVIPEATSS